MNSIKPSALGPKHNLLCASTFIALMVIGGYQFYAAATHVDGIAYPAGIKNFRDGVTTQAIEKALDLKLPMRDQLIAFANTIRYQLLGAGGDQVRIGQQGWLFLTDELKFEGDDGRQGAKIAANNPEESLKERIKFVGQVASRLERQGVTLVVALVPDKARVYQSQLKGQGYPQYNASKYQTALAQLAKNKVPSVDLLDPLIQAKSSQEVFYKTDTHWNQMGAQIAAQQIAAKIAKLNIALAPTSFETKLSADKTQRVGDLIRLMGLETIPNSLRPLPDFEAAATTTETKSEAASAASASPSLGLFGDSAVSVALVGTSYSLRGNFHGYLRASLGTKVLNTAKDGGGFLQALTAYVQDDSFKTSKPKVIVWEIPERMLGAALTDEKKWLNQFLPE